jgi:glutamyl-tRNA synthetase
MDWHDPKTNELTKGFKELGFLPEAFVNLLAVLGWNAGNEQEVFSMEELIDNFSIERVHKGGAKFDFEKAKWYNHEWIKKTATADLRPNVYEVFKAAGIDITDEVYLDKVIDLVKDRCTLVPDFVTQGSFFFKAPVQFDVDAVKPKWNEDKAAFFNEFCDQLAEMTAWDLNSVESVFKNLAAAKNIKPGELQLPMRVMLVGGKFGPAVFEIASLIGKDASISRIKSFLHII